MDRIRLSRSLYLVINNYMKKIHVFANGADFISVDGVCYKRVNSRDRIDTDSSKVVVHSSAEDCKKKHK